MHDVAVAREQCCRVGVLVAQLHKVGPMMIVIVWHVRAYVRSNLLHHFQLSPPQQHTMHFTKLLCAIVETSVRLLALFKIEEAAAKYNGMSARFTLL
jgi:hypothetical protein